MTFDEETGVYTNTFKSPLKLFIGSDRNNFKKLILDPRPIPDLNLKYNMFDLRDHGDFEDCILTVRITNNGTDLTLIPDDSWEYLSDFNMKKYYGEIQETIEEGYFTDGVWFSDEQEHLRINELFGFAEGDPDLFCILKCEE